LAHTSDKEQLLENLAILDRGDSLPLHAQVHHALQQIIHKGFEHGDRFFNEEYLSTRLGVSLATVRRALTDLASEGALERFAGRGTFVRKGEARDERNLHIGVLMPGSQWADGGAADAVLACLDALCTERDYSMHVSYTHGDAKTIGPLWQTGRSCDREGFILLCNPPDTTLDLCRALADRRVPSVNVCTLVDDYPGSSVGVNNGLGIRLGLEYLSALGHQRIALLVNESLELPHVRHRMGSFTELAERSGLDEARVIMCDKKAAQDRDDRGAPPYDDDIDEAVLDSMLNGAARPTAIFSVADSGAWAVLKRLADRGIKVPDEMSVLGFGDEGPSRFVRPTLSTIALPYQAMAEGALALLEEPGERPTIEFLPPALVVRNSTGPAPRE